MAVQYIEIAGISLCFHTEESLKTDKTFEPFRICGAKAPWHIFFTPVKVLPKLPDPSKGIVCETMEYAVYQEENLNCSRWFFDKLDHGRLYAVTRIDVLLRHVYVHYLAEKEKYLNEWGNCFFHIGWEKLLACDRRFIFHAACVQTPLGGILFSGRSGIGKSTQAGLWCRYEDSRLINGDRTVIGRKAEGVWQAYGSPYAGSSGCYLNESCRIRAIVALQQASDCSISKLDAGGAFRSLFAGTTVNRWDAVFVESICTMETALVKDIPVYALACTPEKAAVRLLRNTLEGGI